MDDEIYFDKEKHNGKKILKQDSYLGYAYEIVSYGTHPCCYVYLERGHPFYNVDYNEITIPCHYGLSYSKNDNGFWKLGWDYAHSGDFYYQPNKISSYNFTREGKRYNLKELQNDVEEFIKELTKHKDYTKEVVIEVSEVKGEANWEAFN